jgi:hypothetical protein
MRRSYVIVSLPISDLTRLLQLPPGYDVVEGWTESRNPGKVCIKCTCPPSSENKWRVPEGAYIQEVEAIETIDQISRVRWPDLE